MHSLELSTSKQKKLRMSDLYIISWRAWKIEQTLIFYETIAMQHFQLANVIYIREGGVEKCFWILINLKHLVKFPTRGNNILDIVLTNLSTFFDQPTKRAPFGLLDHMSIEINPIAGSKYRENTVVVKARDLRPSSRLAMRQYLEQVDMPGMLDRVKSCDEKTLLLETIVNTGMDYFLPLPSKKAKLTIHRG